MLNPIRRRRSVLTVALCAAVVGGGLSVPTAMAASTSDDYWSQRDARDRSMDEWEQQLKKRREALRNGGGGSSSGTSGSSSSPSSSGSSGDSADDGGSGKSSTGATKTSDTVVLLGDSTSVDPVASDLEEALKEKGYKKAVIDAVGGSSLIEATKGKTGLERLEALVKKYPDADFIIAMGVNDAANISTGNNTASADKRLDEVMNIAKDVKSVRWLEVDFGDHPSKGNPDLDDDKVHEAAEDFNKSLAEGENKHDNLTLIPWDVDDDMFSDGIHYTSEGYKKRVAAIADSTTEGDDKNSEDAAASDEGKDDKGDDEKDNEQSGSNSVDWDKLDKAVASIADGSTADIGVTVSPATSGSGISASASGEKMYSASTIKIPIAIAVQQNLKPDDTAEITENVGGSGSKQPGTYKVSELLEGMITESDNSATNALITKLGGYDKVNEVIKKITGKNDVKLSNMMMDGTNTSTVTAEGLTKILQRLWADSKDKSGDKKVLSKDKAQEIIDHMYNQTNRIKLPSKIDDDKAVANKTGENTGISHDIGFITNGGKTVAVAVTGKGNADEINAAIGDIGKVIYDWLG